MYAGHLIDLFDVPHPHDSSTATNSPSRAQLSTVKLVFRRVDKALGRPPIRGRCVRRPSRRDNVPDYRA